MFAGLSATYQRGYRLRGFSKHTRILEICESVYDYFGVPIIEMKSKSRTQKIVKPRQIAMHLIRKNVTVSLNTIGSLFGGMDHTTVISSDNTVKGYIESYPGFAKMILEIEDNIAKSFS